MRNELNNHIQKFIGYVGLHALENYKGFTREMYDLYHEMCEKEGITSLIIDSKFCQRLSERIK